MQLLLAMALEPALGEAVVTAMTLRTEMLKGKKTALLTARVARLKHLKAIMRSHPLVARSRIRTVIVWPLGRSTMKMKKRKTRLRQDRAKPRKSLLLVESKAAVGWAPERSRMITRRTHRRQAPRKGSTLTLGKRKVQIRVSCTMMKTTMNMPVKRYTMMRRKRMTMMKVSDIYVYVYMC
jgi:hypothetical protein